jgi:hypothetical protein
MPLKRNEEKDMWKQSIKDIKVCSVSYKNSDTNSF